MSVPTGGPLSNQYVAGLFDGEGCITTTLEYIKGKYDIYPRIRMQVQIANQDTQIMDLLMEWFGGGCIDKHGGDSRRNPCYAWRISGKASMLRFLNYVKDSVIIKKPQVELALEFCGTLREDNLGCVPLGHNIHLVRKRIHDDLRKCKRRNQK